LTAYFDTSAILALHLEVPGRPIAVAALEPVTCTSALALTEALALIDKLTDELVLRSDIEDELRLQWDRYHVVPLDQRCLDRAAALMREQPLRLADALHLAAADRLPRPLRYVTFDPAQIPVAISLGFDVESS
jgi:predicted nucleic acid-binding protein